MSKIHNNDFHLKMTGLSNFKFKITEHDVTEGQPWEGISGIQCEGDGCTITVRAGRKKSGVTADWFKEMIGNGSAMGCDTYDKLPGGLNFAFRGTMSFDHGGKSYIGKDIVIAQGSNARSRNNWWIGGENISEIIQVPAALLGVVSQTFDQGKMLKAKVIFTTSIGDHSTMSMGIIGL